MRLIWPPRRRFLLLRYGEDRSFRVSFRQSWTKVPTPAYPTRETLIADGWC